MHIKKTIHLVALAAVVLITSPAGATAKQEQFARIVSDYGRLDLFSGTVLVAKEGKVIYSGAVGQANKDYRIANALDTSYNIGSIGKTFTAVAIMQLADAGKLAVSDPLGKFLPAYLTPDKKEITLAQLLNHSSGLGNYMAHKDYPTKMHELRDINDVLPLIADEKPVFPAGERFAYSNSGMVLLGAVIEKVSGVPYPAYLRQRIFEPLGMRHSGIVQEDEILPQRSLGYTKTAKGGYLSNVAQIPPAFSDGGLRTTAADLLKFDAALRGNQLLSAASKAAMFLPSGPDPSYGYGWESKAVHGIRFVGHNGGAPGINAEFRRYPATGYALIVLSNYSHGAEGMVDQLEGALFDRAYEPPTQADVNFRLATDLQDSGDAAAAVAVLDRNRNANPPHLLSLYSAARNRVMARVEPQRAIDDLKRYVTLAPKEAQPTPAAAWWRMGNAYEQMNDKAEAIKCYEQALLLDPRMPQPRMDLDKLNGK